MIVRPIKSLGDDVRDVSLMLFLGHDSVASSKSSCVNSMFLISSMSPRFLSIPTVLATRSSNSLSLSALQASFFALRDAVFADGLDVLSVHQNRNRQALHRPVG